MKTIGLLSDTHGSIHPRVYDFFSKCDEIWHAGDIGSEEVSKQLSNFKIYRAVYGNIDNHILRSMHPEFLVFNCESVKVLITHIGGYPGRYAFGIREKLVQHQPGLFITGHSHILKVMPDLKNKLLFINPGAAGNHGLHHKITLLRFCISGDRIHDLEIMEINRKSHLSEPID